MAARKTVSTPAGFIALSSVVDLEKSGKGRTPSPLFPTFSALWEAGNGDGFAIAADYQETHPNSKGEQKIHGITPFKLYAWAKANAIAGSTDDVCNISVRDKKTDKGVVVLVVVPKKVSK